LLHDTRRVLGETRSYPWLRLLTAEGLLDRPQTRGVPGGGRRPGTWSSFQRELFGELLAELRHGAKHHQLCNLVIERWIARGPEHISPRQARRALCTYRDAAGQRRQTRTIGLQIADLFEAEPETMARSMRKRFADAYEAAVHDRFVDRDSLNSKAFSQHIGRSPLGQLLGPQAMILALEALAKGSAAIDHATDETLEASRQLYRLATWALAPRAPDLTAEGLVDSDVTAVVRRNACKFMIATLGIVSQDEKFVIAALGIVSESEKLVIASRELISLLLGGRSMTYKPAPGPLQRPGAMAPGGIPDANQHATARRRAGRGSPQRTAAG
jgi:hypothetical protein